MKISVITVCFNCESTVGQTISSVNQQTYTNIQHVFVDGASTDGTVRVIESKSREGSVLVSEPDEGIYDALNKGLALATGDIVGFLHADDFFAHSRVLAEIAERFAESTIQGVYGDLQYVSKLDPHKIVRRWKTRSFSKTRLKCGWMPPHPTLYIRKAWYDQINGFDTRYKISADYFSVLTLFSNPAFEAHYIPDVLVKMRVGGASNGSLSNILRKSLEDLDALRRSEVGGLFGLLGKNIQKLNQFL